MKYEFPIVKEVNFELKDPHYYIGESLNLNDVSVDITAQSWFSEKNAIYFFAHIRYSLPGEEKSL